MSGFYGADTEQLTEWSEKASSGALELHVLFDACVSAVDSVSWEGPDADAFRSFFTELQFRAAATCDQLDDFASSIRLESAEQDSASSGDDAVGTDSLPFAPFTPGLIPGFPLGSALPTMAMAFDIKPFGWSEDPLTSGWDKLKTFIGFFNDLWSLGDAVTDMKLLGKGASGLDAAFTAIDLGKAIYDGRTGDAIGNLLNLGITFIPGGKVVKAADAGLGALGTITGFKFDAFGQELDFSTNSPLDLIGKGIGNFADEGQAVRSGEQAGQQLSDAIGLSRDGHARKAISTTGGLLSYIGSHGNPASALIDDTMNISHRLGIL